MSLLRAPNVTSAVAQKYRIFRSVPLPAIYKSSGSMLLLERDDQAGVLGSRETLSTDAAGALFDCRLEYLHVFLTHGTGEKSSTSTSLGVNVLTGSCAK